MESKKEKDARRTGKLDRLRHLGKHVQTQAANLLADVCRDEDADPALADLLVEVANFGEVAAARAEQAAERIAELAAQSSD